MHDGYRSCVLSSRKLTAPASYFCPVENREIRISTGTRDEDEAEVQKAELEAKLLLGTLMESLDSIGPTGP